MVLREAAVIAMSENHWMAGLSNTNGNRVLDCLLNPGSNYFNLKDVRVYRASDRSNCILETPEVLLPKDRIQVVAITSGDHEAPMKRLHYFDQKDTFEVNVISGQYDIRGQIGLKDRGVTGHLLFPTLPTFFPISQAEIADGFGEQLSCSVALVNKDLTSLFALPEFASC